MTTATIRRSKTWAAWLALALGTLGIHRIYLHGWRDPWAWLHPPLTAAGIVGLERLQRIGQDDPLAWMLLPVLGLMISQAMLVAIVWGLTPDERWDARFNADLPPSRSGWAVVFAVVLALLVGGTVLMGTIAYGGQKFFEWQIQEERSRVSSGAGVGDTPLASTQPASAMHASA